MKTTINNIEINYNLSGNGKKTLVFIHGFPLSMEMWKEQEKYFSKNFQVLLYDIRGHGKSECGNFQYSIEYFVDDLYSLLEFLKIENPILIGLSMGGYIALRYIDKFLENVSAVVLCDTKSDSDTNEGKINRSLNAKKILEEGTKNFSNEFVKNIFSKKTFENNFEVVKSIQNIIETTSPLSISATLLALSGRINATEVLHKISIPTLILVGEDDIITPVSNAKLINEKIKNSELKIISIAGHMSNIENPKEFNFYLANFLKSL